MPSLSDATRAAILRARPRSAATMQEWREGAAYRATATKFAECAESPERVADCAEALLADAGWAAALLAPLVVALDADPLFEPALKFQRDARRVGIVLFDGPMVSIAARVTNAEAMALPRTIVLTGRIAVIRVVRAGDARLHCWRLAPAKGGSIARAAGSRMLDDGAVYRCDGRTEAKLLCDATRDVVTLVATIRAGAGPLLREYDRESGALVRVADADDRPSRTAMLLRFLREAGRADARACFEEATYAPDFHLRWAAMREWLALDAAGAAPRLAAMATADASDEVRTAAASMLPLVEARLADARCRG